MVYLLHSHFGRDGREEAEALLQRRSGDPATNHLYKRLQRAIPIGFRFSCSRSSPIATEKYRLSRSPGRVKIPLSRSTRFMLTEEAHHMFVGETGVGASSNAPRSKWRSLVESVDQVRALGVIDLPTMPIFEPLVFAVAARFVPAEKSRRIRQTTLRRKSRALAGSGVVPITSRSKGHAKSARKTCRYNAMNEILRDHYVEDCQRAVDKWNRTITQAGVRFSSC